MESFFKMNIGVIFIILLGSSPGSSTKSTSLKLDFNLLQLTLPLLCVQAPDSFRLAVERTVREFSSAIRRKEKSSKFKKDLYYKIKEMDDEPPAYLKATNLNEKLGIV